MRSKIALIFGVCFLFAITVIVLLNVIPGPRKSTDYLVIGTLATFVCLLIVFLINIISHAEAGGIFYRKRK